MTAVPPHAPAIDPVFSAPADPGVEDRPRLIDVIDRLLEVGVVVRGDLWLTVADIELVFIGAKLILAAPETMERLRQPGPEVAA